jgi:hypothetical protein
MMWMVPLELLTQAQIVPPVWADASVVAPTSRQAHRVKAIRALILVFMVSTFLLA